MPSPETCRELAIAVMSSIVGKCRAITTALRLMSAGSLLSLATSIKKPPAQSKARVRSSGIVICDSYWLLTCSSIVRNSRKVCDQCEKALDDLLFQLQSQLDQLLLSWTNY